MQKGDGYVGITFVAVKQPQRIAMKKFLSLTYCVRKTNA
jgi:hypothetical protein